MNEAFPKLRVRGGMLYMRLREGGRRFWKRTGLPVGEEVMAEKVRKAAQKLLDGKAALGLQAATRLTVGLFFEQWMAECDKRGSPSEKERKLRRQRFRDYCEKAFGAKSLDAVKYQHVSDWNGALKGRVDRGELSARMALHAVHLVSQLFRRAVRLELIPASPCDLEASEKIKKVDKDPMWRDTAYFEVHEIEQLISDERISFGDRLTWAFCFFLACRPSEMEHTRWSAYQPAFEPMPKMLVFREKVGAAGPCPVHPTLAAMLAEWRLTGFEQAVGRKPTDADPILPVFKHATANSRNTAVGGVRRHPYTWRRMQLTLEALGLRSRRVYDFRRSLITLAINDFDCSESVLETMTHPSTKSGAFDLYKSKNYRALCREISKVKVERRCRGVLVEIPAVATGSDAQKGAFGASLVPVASNPAETGTQKCGERGIRSLSLRGEAAEESGKGSRKPANSGDSVFASSVEPEAPAAEYASGWHHGTTPLRVRLSALSARFAGATP